MLTGFCPLAKPLSKVRREHVHAMGCECRRNWFLSDSEADRFSPWLELPALLGGLQDVAPLPELSFDLARGPSLQLPGEGVR